MKLLFDQNLSPRLVQRLQFSFPDSRHVSELELSESPDIEVWRCAERDGFVVVSKDRDFAALSLRLGAPPQVIWIGTGNCSTKYIEQLLQTNADTLHDFHQLGSPAIIDLR